MACGWRNAIVTDLSSNIKIKDSSKRKNFKPDKIHQFLVFQYIDREGQESLPGKTGFGMPSKTKAKYALKQAVDNKSVKEVVKTSLLKL